VKGRFGLYEETDEFVGVFGQGWILGKEKKTQGSVDLLVLFLSFSG
jgi:hypothetical protein